MSSEREKKKQILKYLKTNLENKRVLSRKYSGKKGKTSVRGLVA